ncbi:DUF6571 family protein [Actinomyces howellii]|uniref:DUF6571 domain-containing protein n=1 Tax=Actinomyces howellii TaxID=52771 RepID=A0A448HH83_9ACTO|nr:DUF6571 family protein [Actinomyces howellii]VEG28390.1 Uncharacterised protein [Actinomyces howellii]
MVTLYMNPDRLQEAIDCLDNLAAEGDSIRQSIDTEFNHEGDPIDPTVDLNNISAACTAVRNRATEIRTCRQTIIDLNENGVASMNADGTITCTVPDTVDINNSSDLTSWAQAETDAHDLDVLLDGGEPATGRTYDEVVASMSTNNENGTYAAAFIDAAGPENLTSLPGLAREHNERTLQYGVTYDPNNSAETLAGLLGEILAQASSTWDATEAQAASDAIVSSVDDPSEHTRIPALNAMMGGHDANGDHVNDLKFGNDFLLAMATGLEEVDLEAIEQYRDSRRSYDSSSGYDVQSSSNTTGISDPCYDPLAGVLDAMGNNPDAAAAFLAPPASGDATDPQADMTRMKTLAARDWDPTGFAGLTAAVAAASSIHTTTTDSSAATRSWQLAGTAVHQVALHGEESLYNDDAKARVGILLANCSGAVTSLWKSGTATDMVTDRKLPDATEDDVDALAYIVADSPEAVATISAGLAAHASELSDHLVEHWQQRGDDGAQQTYCIGLAHGNGIEAAARLAGIADRKAADLTATNKQASEDATQAANTAAAVFAAVATAPMGPWAAAATTVGATVFTHELISNVVGADITDAESPLEDNPKQAYVAAAVQDASDAGLITQEALQSESAKYSWIQQDPNGIYYVDLSNLPPSRHNEVVTWLDRVASLTEDETLMELNTSANGRYGDGHSTGSSVHPSNNPSSSSQLTPSAAEEE